MTDPSVHVTEDEIAAYHAGTLPPDEEARVQDHLLECSECTELLLGLEELALEDDEPTPPEEVRAAWEELRSRLPAAAPAALPAPLPYPRRRAQPAWLPALAAGLAAAVLGLGVWNVSLQNQRDELNRPDVHAQFVEISADTLRGDGTADAPALKPQGRWVTLALRPGNSRGFADYEVELAGADGTVIWRDKGLRRQESGYFFLTLRRQLLESGDRLRLWGIEEGRREVVIEYSLGAHAPPRGR